MRLPRSLRAVLWDFLGVRRGADAARLLVVAFLIVGIAVAAHFLLGPRRVDKVIEAARIAPPFKSHGPVLVRDTMEQRVQTCTACHASTTQATKDGFSPRIAGKPAGYLLNQLLSFRDGRRVYPPMVYLVQYMTDDYLREIAAYFAGLALPYPPPESIALIPAEIARARQIVEHGDPARDVPACVECHGTTLSGLDPAIPGLLGLPRQYMSEQFGAWRNGRLRSVAPDCMAEVARRLAAEDVHLLAAWLAAQPVPAGTKPASAPRKLPLECGSVEAALDKESPVLAPSGSSIDAGRGRYLVAAGDCIACHTAIGGAPFAGGRAIETPFGMVHSSNITPDVASGIGGWSRDDFLRAVHNGRLRYGRLFYPAFPYPNFTQVTREDADAMFDYLRTLPPASQANKPHALRFPYNTQAALAAWRALFFHPGEFEPDQTRSADWNRGAYLVRGLGHCDACHASRNIFGAVSHSLDLGGGLIPMQKWYAPPLVSSWEPNHIVALLGAGVSPRGMAMGPMAEVVYRSTQYLSPEDVRAIAAYLQSLTTNVQLESQAAPAVGTMARGATVYADYCAECHGDNGEGAFPAYPPLARNPSVSAELAANAIKAVLNGGYPPVTSANRRPYGMPPFFGKLSDRDVAAVLTYLRASWGNGGAPVSTVDVERYR